jgi:type VI protein secretion system component Hcp
MADTSEILMKIVASGSSAIAAECNLVITPGDQLMEGFEAGRFFQIKDFNFSAGLQDESGGAGGEKGGTAGTGSGEAVHRGSARPSAFFVKPAVAPYANTRAALAMMQAAQAQGSAPDHAAARPGQPAKGETKPKAPKTKFSKWRNERAANAGSTRYPLEVEPVTFTRYMDQASTTLLQALFDSQSLASASIVRRIDTGSGAAAYLRLDFTDLLIVGIDWDDDELIEEKFKFICRGVQVRFRPQNSDGSLGAAISGSWPAK